MPDHLVASCTTAQEALEACINKQPTLLISTQTLEDGNGFELISQAKSMLPELKTLLFLQHDHLQVLEHAIGTHSDGILLESSAGSSHILAAIRTVTKGGMYLEPEIVDALRANHQQGNHQGLTSRELEVMQHVAWGLNDREIGEKLHISIDTVKYHLKQSYNRLQLHNRTRAAIALVLTGIIEPIRPLFPS